MKLNILIVSKYHWASRLKKHEEIKRILKLGKFENVTIDTVKKDLKKPEIVNERITEGWFEHNISREAKLQGYDFAIFQFSHADGKRWGIESGVRGTNFIDKDFFGEAWVCSDEDSIIKFRNGTERDKYSKTVPHEIAHELKRQGYTKLDIHDYDYKNTINNLEQFYIEFSKTVLDNLTHTVIKLSDDLLPLVRRKRDELVAMAEAAFTPIRVTSEYRSIADQDKLYAHGRTTSGNVVTNAKGGESFHNYGVAFDVCFDSATPYEGNWQFIGALGEKIGLEWGGRWADFKDEPHFQLRLGHTLQDFQNKKVAISKYT